MAVQVDADNRQQAHAVHIEALSQLLADVLAAQSPEHASEVGLAFVEIDEMSALNIEHMGGTGPTDVLAFPIDGVASAATVPEGQPAMLGDIVICPAIAAKAPQDLVDELALLVVHGALHLVGHDHAEPDETALMKAIEVEMLDRFHSGSDQ